MMSADRCRQPFCQVCLSLMVMAFFMTCAMADSDGAIWSVQQLKQAIDDDAVILVDVRSRDEWKDTGLADGALPISMHERGFAERLFKLKALAGDTPVALICATGGRTATLMRALRSRGKEAGFVDVSEGMMGSRLGPGWIRAGLPLQSLEEAEALLPFE